MPVVHPRNSSDTGCEVSGIRILSRIHFISGIPGAFLWFIALSTLGPQKQLSALPDLQPTRKTRTRGSGSLKKHSRIPLHPDFHPLVVKIVKNRFLGDLGPKSSQNGLHMDLPREKNIFFKIPQKNFSKKYFFIFSIFIEILVKNWSSGNMEKIENQLFWSFSRFKLFTCT